MAGTAFVCAGVVTVWFWYWSKMLCGAYWLTCRGTCSLEADEPMCRYPLYAELASYGLGVSLLIGFVVWRRRVADSGCSSPV